MAWQTISVLIVEYGFYITEQKTTSYFSGGALRTISSHLIFFAFYYILASQVRRFPPKAVQSKFSNKTSDLIIIWISLGLSLIYINISISPSPIFNQEITRFNYMENSALPWIKYITSERFFYAFSLLGATSIYFHQTKNTRKFKISIFLYAALLISLFLVGEKFTAPLLGTIILSIYLLSGGFSKNYKLKIKTRHKAIPIAIFIGILCYVYYMYSFKYELSDRFGSPLLAVLYRGFVLQGHTQWGVDALYASKHMGSLDLWLKNNFSGMSIAMNAIAPKSVLDAFSQVSNASFSSAYPGVALYTGGWLLVILMQIFLASAYFIFSFILARAIKSGHLLSGFLSMQALYSIFYIYNMGNFNELFSAKFLLSTTLLGGIILSRIALGRT